MWRDTEVIRRTEDVDMQPGGQTIVTNQSSGQAQGCTLYYRKQNTTVFFAWALLQ